MSVLYNPESPDNKASRELRDVVKELKDIVKDLNDSIKRTNLIMNIFTFILVAIAVYQFIQLFTIQIPFTKLQTQIEIHKVIEGCQFNPEATWFDQNGNTRKCSEVPKEWLQK